MDPAAAELALNSALLLFSGWLVSRSVFRFFGLASVRRFEKAILSADADRARQALSRAARWAPHRLGRSGILNRATLDARLVPSSLPPERIGLFLLDVLGDSPLPPVLAIVKAHLLRQQGRLEQARELVEGLVPPRIGRLTFYQSQGLFYELAGDLPSAVEFYRRALALLEKRRDARGRRLRSTLHRSIAQVLTRLGRYDEAAASLSSSLGLEECSVEAVFTRIAQAGLHERLGDHRRAADLLQEGLSCCTAGSDILHQALGELHTRAGDFDAAELEFEKAMEHNRKLLSAYVARADLELTRGRPEEGFRWLERASDLAPANQAVLTAKARYYEQQGDEVAALACLERAVDSAEAARGPFQELAHDAAREKLARCYARLGRTADAMAEYRRAVKAGSSSPTLLLSLALLEEAEGAPEAAATLQRAREALSERLRHAPADGALQRSLGRLSRHDGDLEKALQHLRQAAVHSPDEFETWWELGEVCRLAGEPEPAREAWVRAAELARRPDQKESVRRRLEGEG